MVFPVEADISQQGIEGMPPIRLLRQAMELQVVRLGAPVKDHPQHQVLFHVDDRRNLGKPVISPAATMAEVGGRRAGIHPRGVDGGQLAAVRQKLALAGQRDGGGQEAQAAPFFSSRRAASCNVRKCGTWAMPMAVLNSDHLDSQVTVPR